MKSLLVSIFLFILIPSIFAQSTEQEPDPKSKYLDINFNYSLPLGAFKSQDFQRDDAGHALQGIGGMIGYTSNFKNSNLGWYTAIGYFRNEQQNFVSGKMAATGDTLLLSNVFHETIPFLTGPAYRYDTGSHVIYARFNFAVAIARLSAATFDTSEIENALEDETRFLFARKIETGYSIELGFIINRQLSIGFQLLNLGLVEHEFMRRSNNTHLQIPKDSNAIQMLNLKIGWVFMGKK